MDFTVSGSISLGRGTRNFSRTVSAQSENEAKEKTLALFGSQNGVKRSRIRIEKVEKKK